LIQPPKGANIVFSEILRGSTELARFMQIAISAVTLYESLRSRVVAILLGLDLLRFLL
jgi:hypothetical protein